MSPTGTDYESLKEHKENIIGSCRKEYHCNIVVKYLAKPSSTRIRKTEYLLNKLVDLAKKV